MSYRPEWSHDSIYQPRQPWHRRASAEAWLGRECLEAIRKARKEREDRAGHGDSPHQGAAGAAVAPPLKENDDVV